MGGIVSGIASGAAGVAGKAALGPLGWGMMGVSALKGIFGAIQSIKGRKEQKKLWADRPQLGVTAGETEGTSLYKQMAAATEMPGQRRAEEKLGQAYAEGVSDISKTAISSLGATKGAVDLSGKKMQAIQDLAGQFAEYKSRRQDALGQWNRQRTELETQRFQVNQYEPWGQRMNEAVSRKQAGFGAFGGAIDSTLGFLGDLQGTKQYMEMIKSLYPNLGGGGGFLGGNG